MASPKAKKMAEEFLAQVQKESQAYHKSWSRKFGNKYQSAKNWIKRDKKMVAMDMAKMGVKQGISLIPFPGSQASASLFEKAGGSALRALTRRVGEEGTKKGVKSLLTKKIEAARMELKTGANLKMDNQVFITMDQKRDLQINAIRKLVKYEIKLLPKKADELSLRLFKLKEATQSSRKKLSQTVVSMDSSEDSTMERMQAWVAYFTAVQEVQHYQDKLRETLVHVQEITRDVELYLASSEAATSSMVAENLPKLEEAFDQISRGYGNIHTLKQLQAMMVEKNLIESGLMDPSQATFKYKG